MTQLSRWQGILLLLGMCLIYTQPQAADSSDSSEAEPASADALRSARSALAEQDYAQAIEALKQALTRDPESTDALNLMGYSLRKSGELDQALVFYKKALAIEPEHLGANEYLGELYLQRDQLAQAEQRLSVLDSACFMPCEEFTDLQKAIADYRLPKRKGMN